MGNADYKDDQLIVKQFVHDAVGADAQAAQTAQPALEDSAGRRSFAQPVDGLNQAPSRRLGNSSQIS